MDSDLNAMAGNAAMTPEHIAGEEPGPGPGASGGWGRLRPAMRWESGLVVVVIVIAIMGSALSPEFLTANNFFNLGLNTGEIAIMALPMALIIISGEIDLSVESTLGMSSAVLGVLWADHWPMLAIFAVVAVVGVLAGAVNGLLVTRVGLPSLAVTIGTLALYRGIALILLGQLVRRHDRKPHRTVGLLLPALFSIVFPDAIS